MRRIINRKTKTILFEKLLKLVDDNPEKYGINVLF